MADFPEKDLTFQDLCALARRDFGTFVELTFPVLHPGQKLDPAPYLDVLTGTLQNCGEDEATRLIVNLPPGFMKSMLFSIMYVAWRLGLDPTFKVICISYGDDLANKHSAATRRLMQSELYQRIFPGVILDKKAENWLTTTKGGYRYSTAVGSDITGFRPRQIIVDDPIEPEQGHSEIIKQNLRNWILSSVLTRFEDNKSNAFILVMHRIAPDDLAGTLLAQGHYDHISMPLVAEEAETYADGNEQIIMQRKVGDFLHPGRMDQEALERLKREVAPHVFSSQYQQRPVLAGSGFCSIDRIGRYKTHPPRELLIHSWDVGATTTGNASVCTKWAVCKNANGHDVSYLVDVVRIRKEIPDLRAAIKALDRIDKPDMIGIDHRGVGLGLFQELRKDGYRHVFPGPGEAKTNESKIDRFARALTVIYDHHALFPESALFMEMVLHDLAAFPHLKELDLIDSMTQYLAYTKNTLMFARQKHRPPYL